LSSYIFSIIRSSSGVLISRIFGLIRDVVIASVYGATGLTDIFFVAFAIPNLFRQFFVEGALSSAFMPFLAEKFKIGGAKMQNIYLTQLIIVQSIIISIITIIIMIFADYIIMMFIPGYANDKFFVDTGSDLLRIVMPFLLLISFSGLFSGLLNLHGSYFISYSSSALFNIMMIIGAWIGYKTNQNIYYLAYATIAGGVLQAITIYISSYIYGFRPKLSTKLDQAVKQTYLLILPSIIGVSISQINFLIGRVLASYLAVGSISWLFYANRLFQFPLGVLSVAVGVVSLTELSKARAINDVARLNQLIDNGIIILLVFILPSTIGLIMLAEGIVKLLFYRDNFTLVDLYNTADALRMYSIGLIFFSLINLLTRVFHSFKDTKTPVKAAFVGLIVNVILNIILMQFLAHSGIALASSISALVNVIILYYLLKNYKFQISKHKSLLIKLLSANIFLIGKIFLFKYLGIDTIIIIITSVIFYFLYLYSLKINIIKMLR